jgi:hypothetical protein
MQFFHPHLRRDSDIGLDNVGNRPVPPVIRGPGNRGPAHANEVLSQASSALEMGLNETRASQEQVANES